MKDRRLAASGLAALVQGDSGPRVLALHGWLDNAGSFCPMAPWLEGCQLVCLDFPGHGQSPHRPEGLVYHFDDYLFDVLAAADELGWKTFHLLGHSLGGAVSSLIAAACPDRVLSLSLIEGLGPMSAAASKTANQWRKAVRASHSRPRRTHPDRDSAIAARARGSDLDQSMARTLAERGLISVEGGYQWGHDQRLTWPTGHYYTEPQVLDLLAAIEAPVLNLYSDPPSGILPRQLLIQRVSALARQRLHALPGGHHLHMRYPRETAALVLEHINA